MQNNNPKFENLSFWQLIDDTKIEIPIIQRDYAQGRSYESEIRNNILDSFKTAIEGEPIELDFIYGSKKDSCLQPLDGQQRLTTLFLVHWYIANKEKQISQEVKKLLIKFTYETRISSREFCIELVEKGINFDKLLSADDGEHNQLSKTIIDSNWFFLSWKKDPTIQSMLNMLDSIHGKFNDSDAVWDKLISKNKITFQYVELENFGLSDDLYIKMNARGKPLTPFENFRAKIEQLIQKEYESLKDNFSKNIDGAWTDLFWEYKNERNLFDADFMTYFRVMAANCYALKQSSKNDFEVNLKDLRDKNLPFSFNKYKNAGCFDKDYITQVSETLDKLSIDCIQNKSIKTYLPDSLYINEKEIFGKAIKNDLGYAELVTFYAYTLYLSKETTIDERKFNDWMRVIRNLVEGSRTYYFNTAHEYANFIKLISGWIEGRDDIIGFFANNNFLAQGFLKAQIEEEQLKAILILKDENWKKAIIDIENHGYFKGQIDFLLGFSGVSDFFKENKNIDWSDAENEKYLTLFNFYINIVKIIFDDNGLNKDFENYIFERALLTKGDYLLQRTSNYSFLIDNERDISWKRLLRDNNGKRKILKDLLDSFGNDVLDLGSIKANLQKIIGSFYVVNDWRYYFVKYPEIIKNCGQERLIRWYDEQNILLLATTTTSGYHKEYYSFAFSLNQKSKTNERIVYYPQRSINDEKYFLINDDVKVSFVKKQYKIVINDVETFFDDQLNAENFLKLSTG